MIRRKLLEWLLKDIDRLRIPELEITRGQTIYTDVIQEKTADSGVTVDGCLIKDGKAADADKVDGKEASELGIILDRDESGNLRYEDTPNLIDNNDISGSCSAGCPSYCDAYSDTFVKTPDIKFVKCHCEFYPTTDGARCRFKLSDGTNTVYTGYTYDSASVWVGCTKTVEISQLQNTTITVTVQLCGGNRQARYLQVYKNKLTSLV